MSSPSLKESENDKKIEVSQVENVVLSEQDELAAQQTAFEKGLTFWETIRIYWRSTLWILYGMAVVFNYGIDGIIAGNILAIPQFR